MLLHLVATYGYLAVFLGTFLEGETILVLAGLAAHEGYLSFATTVAAAWAGSVSGDQLYFWIGRRWGQRWLAVRPSWRARLTRIDRVITRYPALFVLGFRFLYGLRTISPFALGMSTTPAYKFVVLNAAGGALWALLIAWLGYLFGGAVEALLGRARHYEVAIFVLAGVIGLGVALTQGRRARRTIDAEGPTRRPPTIALRGDRGGSAPPSSRG